MVPIPPIDGPVLHYIVDPNSPFADAASFFDGILHLLVDILRFFGIGV